MVRRILCLEIVEINCNVAGINEYKMKSAQKRLI